MGTLFDNLKEKFKSLFSKQIVVIKETKIINGRKIIDVEKDLSPENAQRISEKTDKMFDNFGKRMDEMFTEMNKDMNDVFHEIDELK